ncbi:DUF1194 domain-containing protein [Falsiroseomonas sp. HC035]|uniref:DUF1194 domain-containing protein n=1 Tax=Falsiroseomonas sp. HC035 TaxID=3390999 RepID=UPI003D3236EF
MDWLQSPELDAETAARLPTARRRLLPARRRAARARTPEASVFMQAATCPAAIVLLIDASASVPDRMYLAQRDGTAAAFEDPRLTRRLKTSGPLAVLVAEFAFVPLVRLEWTVVRDAEDARRFAADFRGLRRSGWNGNTAIGHALAFAVQELVASPCAAGLRIIDISTDGVETNPRVPARDARDSAAAEGIVVNAIAFPTGLVEGADDRDKLLAEAARWLRENVATGFVRVADRPAGFLEAFREKVVFEIAQLPDLAT